MARSRRVVEVIHGRPSVRIGKGGLSEGLIHEIRRRLEEEGVIKVRVLRSYLASSAEDTRSVAEAVSRLTGSELVTVRGHVFVLRKRGKRGKPGP